MTPRKSETEQEFRERRSAYLRKVRRANPEKNRATVQAWNKSNPERKRMRDSSWRENNLERMRSIRKAWKERNPDKIRVYKATRRARAVAGGKLSINIVSVLMLKQGGCCAICALELSSYHLDHIQPLSRGGSNTDANVQLLCPPCNWRKGPRVT